MQKIGSQEDEWKQFMSRFYVDGVSSPLVYHWSFLVIFESFYLTWK